MRIQDIHDALTEYDHSEKPWWRKIVGAPTIIKKIKLFSTSLSALPLLPDPTRQLTDEEMFRFYQILLDHENKKDRKKRAMLYEYHKGNNELDKFDESVLFSSRNSESKIVARIFYGNFHIQAFEALDGIKVTQEVFTAVQKHPAPDILRSTTDTLRESGLLTEPNFTAVAQHRNPEQFSKGLHLLNRKSLLTGGRFETLRIQENPEQSASQVKPTTTDIKAHLAEYDSKKGFLQKYIFTKDPDAVRKLRALATAFGEEERPLTEDEELTLCKSFNFKMFSRFDKSNKSAENTYLVARLNNHFKSEYSAIGNIVYFQELITPDLFKLLKANPKQNHFSGLLSLADHYLADFMNQEILGLFFKNEEPELIELVISNLATARMVFPENVAAFVQVLKQPTSAALCSLEHLILRFKLFNQANFTTVANYPDPVSLYYALHQFTRINLLSQTDFDDAVKYAHVLGCESVTTALNKRFKNGSQSDYLETFTRIVELCRNHKGNQESLLPAIIRLIQIGNDVKFDQFGNTHTESVHKTASESAVRLWANYGVTIDSLEELQETISEIDTWVKTLSGISGEAAQRAIKRLQLPEEAYLDSVSQITNLQLLALFWKAIHDETKRESSSTLEEAKHQLHQALYEIQRGNNLFLNKDGALIDNLKDDNIICESGVFNKLVEKLFTIHPDAEMQSVTLAGALAKFPIVVQEEASIHVVSLRKTMEPSEFAAMVLKFKDDGGINIIWPHIEKAVNNRMMDEYGVLYKTKDFPDGINHPKYQLILQGLPYVELTKLHAYSDSELLTSKASSAMYSEKSSLLPPAHKVLSSKEEAYQTPEKGF